MTRAGRAGRRPRIRIAAATLLTILALAAPGAVLGVLIGNRTPVALPDAYTVRAGEVLNVATPGVLANDTDADGDPLLALISTVPGNGTATLAPTGGLIYVPNPGFSGTDTFTYVVTDAVATSAPAEVTIDVTPAPTPTPTATPAATATPLPTPIPIPSLVPIPSLTLTATPTPAASAGPGPSGGPSPSPTSSPAPLAGSSTPPGGSPEPLPSAASGVVGVPSAPPAPPGPGSGGDAGFSIPIGSDRDRLEIDPGSFGVGGFDGLVELALPAIIVSGSGLLLLLAIGAQAVGGLAWLPIARRKIGAFGVTPARRLRVRRARA